MPSSTLAMAPTICATTRPANEIHASRAFSAFLRCFFSSGCSATGGSASDMTLESAP
jgi:hypothetical protein